MEYPNGISKEEAEEHLKSYIIESPNLEINNQAKRNLGSGIDSSREREGAIPSSSGLTPKPDDPLIQSIPCECGKPNCDNGLLIRKYPGDKVKIQVFEGNEIKSVVIDKNKLAFLLEELK